MKTAVVVSGGDAPGINAAIKCTQELAERQGDQVLGAHDGFAGLLAGNLVTIDRAALSLLAGRGGSILRSSREPVQKGAEARDRLGAVMAEQGIDNLLLFGGDGTLGHVLPLLDSWGVSCVALPTTIDNDIADTDYTMGHDSACNFALQAVDGIRATANGLPGRIFLLETLGAPTGYLALAVAHAGGAHAVLLPEYEIDMHWLASRLRKVVARDGFALVVLSEAVPAIETIVAEIPQRTCIRLRYTALGHAQRGADASHYDRFVAREMSRIAWRALKIGGQIGAVVMRDGVLAFHRGTLPRAKKAPPDYDLYAHINELC